MAPVRGVMAVWNDLAPGHEPAFEAWYENQHVRERLHVPGFRLARRYMAHAGSPRYCAFYWLDDVAVLASPAYLARLANPTATTSRMMRSFRDMARTPCTIALQRGSEAADRMGWIAMTNTAAGPPPLDAIQAAFDRIETSGELARMQFWQCSPSVAGLHNPEQRLRAREDRVAAWIVFVEASNERAVDAALDALSEEFARMATTGRLLRAPVYRLVSSLTAEEAAPPCSDDVLG